MDIKKKVSSAKGTVTRATGLIDEQERLEPAKHTEAALRRLTTRLNNAEESYESAYKSLEDPTEVEYEAYADFQSSVEDQRPCVEHLKLMHTAYAKAEDLSSCVAPPIIPSITVRNSRRWMSQPGSSISPNILTA